MTALKEFMTAPAAASWGRWHLADGGTSLCIVDGHTERYVPLDECRTDAGRWFWTRQYAGKGWTTAQDVADLVDALAELEYQEATAA